MVDTKKFLKNFIDFVERKEMEILSGGFVAIDLNELRRFKREAEKCVSFCAYCNAVDRQKILKLRDCVKKKIGSMKGLAEMLGISVSDVRYLLVHGRCRSVALKKWFEENCGIEIDLNGKVINRKKIV